jgi:peptidoglycan/LPS O-acetylase OafA/YrhL
MKDYLLKITLYRWYRIKNNKKWLAELLFFVNVIIAAFVAGLDLIIKDDRVFMEPLTLLVGLTGSISYGLLSFSNCLIVRKRKLPIWIPVLLAGILCIMSCLSVVTGLLVEWDGSFTPMWIYLAIMTLAFSHNTYLARASSNQQINDE